MGKILSEKERKLQKKLIPLNIFVCILSIVAAASLMFGQIFSVDAGKILSSDTMVAYVDDAINGAVEGSTSGSETGDVDFRPVISKIVSNVLGSAEGSLNISAFGAAKVAFASGDDKATKVMDELFFGDGALVTRLIDSTVENVTGMFKTDEGKQLIEEIVVSTITTSIVAHLSEEDAAKVTENISDITATFKKIGNAENRDAAEASVNEFVDKLDSVLGSSLDEESGDAIKDYIMNMYDDTTAETDNFSIEAMISVAVSKNVDLGNFDLGGLFDGLVGGGEPEGEPEGNPEGGVHKRLVDEEVGGTIEEGNDTPSSDESDRVICTTYDELLQEMGLDENKTEELKSTLKSALQDLVQGYTEPIAEYFAYYGYVFYGMLAFIVPWLILFLFSFFHMFAKNKRFMMWYVKLYSWIPGLISLVFILAPTIFDKLPEGTIGMEEQSLGIVKTVLGGISSTMWISGICFILLWLVSIFWAFPIKHKIRKERKLAKLYGGNNGGGPVGGAPNGGNGGNYYQPPYGNNTPNNGPYGGNNYYGANQYGANPYGGNANAPYGGILDQDAYDHGGFNTPYTGSYYGFDEDDF